MDAGIQRPGMANLEPPQILNQALAQPASYRPWHWIPAFPAGMTAEEPSCQSGYLLGGLKATLQT
jgi:hypothetical protein